MNTTLFELKTAASALPAGDRAELAQFLLRTLDGDEAGTRAEWATLAEHRFAEIEAGMVVGVPAEEVLRTLLERVT